MLQKLHSFENNYWTWGLHRHSERAFGVQENSHKDIHCTVAVRLLKVLRNVSQKTMLSIPLMVIFFCGHKFQLSGELVNVFGIRCYSQGPWVWLQNYMTCLSIHSGDRVCPKNVWPFSDLDICSSSTDCHCRAQK